MLDVQMCALNLGMNHSKAWFRGVIYRSWLVAAHSWMESMVAKREHEGLLNQAEQGPLLAKTEGVSPVG